MGESKSDRLTALIDERPIGGMQWVTIILCGLVMFLDGFDTQSIAYVAPAIAKEWQLQRALLGPIFSAALVGLMVGYLALAPLSDRFGHKRMVIYFSLEFALATLACSLANDVTSLMVLRFLTGVGLGAAIPSAVALTGEYSPRRFRASFVLAIYCGFSLGFVAAGIATSWLLGPYGWRSMFWAGAIPSLVLMPFLFWALPEAISTLTRPGADRAKALAVLRRLEPSLTEADIPARAPEVKAPLRRLFSGGMGYGTLLLWGVFLINLGEFYALQSWLPTILHGFHYPQSTVVMATTLTTVGGIVAAFIVGPAMDRINPYWSLVTLYVVGFLFTGSVGLALQGALPLLLTATFLAGLCISGGQKSVISLAAVFYPAAIRSTGVGWALGIGRLGGIAGPLVVGVALTAGLAPRAVFYLLAVPMLVMALAILLMGLRYSRMAAAGSIAETRVA
jgi:AAHS family 4-hydroxybenzoate transporter-like MFS transporter